MKGGWISWMNLRSAWLVKEAGALRFRPKLMSLRLIRHQGENLYKGLSRSRAAHLAITYPLRHF